MAISARDSPRHRALVLLAHLRRVPAVRGRQHIGRARTPTRFPS